MVCEHNLGPLPAQLAHLGAVPCWCEVEEPQDGILFRIDDEIFTFVALPIRCFHPECPDLYWDVESWLDHIVQHLGLNPLATPWQPSA